MGKRLISPIPGLLAILGVLGAFGCGTLPHSAVPDAAGKERARDPALVCQHVLEVSAEGFLYDLRSEGKPHLITDKDELRHYLETTIFAAVQTSRKNKILLFVHGGLDDRAAGMDHFWNDYRQVMQGEYYPVFVVWPSGWSATYAEHLLWVRQGLRAETPNEKAFGLCTSPFMLLADLGRAVTRLPLVVANNSRSDIETVTPIRNREGGAAVQQYQQLARQNYAVAIGDDYSLPVDRTGRAVTYWATLPAKYTIGSFIDGLGKGAWDNMLRRTQEVYPARLDERTVRWTEQLQATNASSSTSARPAGTQRSLTARQATRHRRYKAAGLPGFMAALREHQARDAGLAVTLIGHSMGCIILNRLIRDADLDIENIVYMGAACSVEDYSTSVLPYLKEHHHTQFYGLSLHPVAEAGEWYTALADLPPRGSLLVWIDNFLSNPVTEQERTLGRWRNLFRSSPTGEPIIRQLFDSDGHADLKQQLHFQAFSVGFGDKDQLRPIQFQWNEHPIPKDAREREDNPLSHGEFTDMPYWTPKFWWQPAVAGGKAHQAPPGRIPDNLWRLVSPCSQARVPCEQASTTP